VIKIVKLLDFIELGESKNHKKHVSVIFYDGVFKNDFNLLSTQTQDLNFPSSAFLTFSKQSSTNTNIQNFTKIRLFDNSYIINRDTNHILNKHSDTRFFTKSNKLLEYNFIHDILFNKPILQPNSSTKGFNNLGSLQDLIKSGFVEVNNDFKKTIYDLFESGKTFKELELFEQHAILGVILDKTLPNISGILENIFKKSNTLENNVNNSTYITIFKNSDTVE